MKTGDQSISGSKIFDSTIIGSINGNAATVTKGIYKTSSVTELSDITSVGSGEIITSDERKKINNITDIGSGASNAWSQAPLRCE